MPAKAGEMVPAFFARGRDWKPWPIIVVVLLMLPRRAAHWTPMPRGAAIEASHPCSILTWEGMSSAP